MEGSGCGPSSSSPTTEWNPLELLESAIVAGQVPRGALDKKYAIILLNQQVINEELFLSLWNEASVRILVDGGANHWHHLSRKFPDLVQLPHILCGGDLSRIRRETLEVLRRHKDEVQVIKFEDVKKESDFTGALQLLIEKEEFKGIWRIIAYNETSGGLSEIMGNIQTLYKCCGRSGNRTQVFLMSSSSISFLLPQGPHKIMAGRVLNPFLKIKECALLPVGSSCKVSTQGLREDLIQEHLSFGSKVILNNGVIRIQGQFYTAQITTTSPILWSMGLEFDNQLKNVW